MVWLVAESTEQCPKMQYPCIEKTCLLLAKRRAQSTRKRKKAGTKHLASEPINRVECCER